MGWIPRLGSTILTTGQCSLKSKVSPWPVYGLARTDLTDLVLHSPPVSHYSHDELPPQLTRPKAQPETRAWQVFLGCRSEGVGRVRQGGGQDQCVLWYSVLAVGSHGSIPLEFLREGLRDVPRRCPMEGEETGRSYRPPIPH